MKISVNWIKEFVNLDGIEIDEIIKRFNLATAEIEKIEYMGKDIDNVVLAKIIEVENHPQSKKLHVLKVEDGSGKLVQVVCGASNVRVGMITAFAREGACVKGVKISQTKLAGVDSFGMCCSEAELGIGSDDSGIMDITSTLPMGTKLQDVFAIDDVILEIENKTLTNRPDLWGHYGIAREIATIFNRELKPLEVADLQQYKSLPALDIKVETDKCLRYSALSVSNVTVAQSLVDIKIKLNYCGMRDINLLADLTNYLMLELGLPLHAFDNQVVKGIVVKEVGSKTQMKTLEGGEHELLPPSVVIGNQFGEPVAVAGVKGGLHSGISENTTSFLLESAVFDAVSVRKTAKSLHLVTDASLRYEKSLDPENTPIAIARLLHILQKIDKDVVISSAFTDVYNYKYPICTIEILYDFINKKSGIILSQEKVKQILKGLGFEFIDIGGGLKLTVPSWRATKDISIAEDIVEEVLRIYGYENITPNSIMFNLEPIEQSKLHTSQYESKKLLSEKYGVSEVHSYIWNYEDFNKMAGIEQASVVHLVDSSNSGQSGIRSKLTPSLLKIAYENRNNFNDIKICEIGRVVSGLDKDNLCNENTMLSVVLLSTDKSEKELYFELKTMLDNICKSVLKTKVQYVYDKTSNYFHPVNSNVIKTTNNVVIGEMGVLHPKSKGLLDFKHSAVMLEVNFKELTEADEVINKPKEVSKYQSVEIDLNFLVPDSFSYAQLEEIISSFKTPLNMQYNLKDIYKDNKLENIKSFTFNFIINSYEKTLEEKDIKSFSDGLVAEFYKQGIELKQLDA